MKQMLSRRLCLLPSTRPLPPTGHSVGKKWFLRRSREALEFIVPLPPSAAASLPAPRHSSPHQPRRPGFRLSWVLPHPGLGGDSPGTSRDGLTVMKASDRPALTGCWAELISRTGMGICGGEKRLQRLPEPPGASPDFPAELQSPLPARRHLLEDSKAPQIQTPSKFQAFPTSSSTSVQPGTRALPVRPFFYFFPHITHLPILFSKSQWLSSLSSSLCPFPKLPLPLP